MNKVQFIQEVSAVCTSPLLDTDELKMAFRAEKFPGLLRNGQWSGRQTALRVAFLISRTFRDYSGGGA